MASGAAETLTFPSQANTEFQRSTSSRESRSSISLNAATAVPELLYPETVMQSGIFTKKMPPLTETPRAPELWTRSKLRDPGLN